jgi:hypothetical protein
LARRRCLRPLNPDFPDNRRGAAPAVERFYPPNSGGWRLPKICCSAPKKS